MRLNPLNSRGKGGRRRGAPALAIAAVTIIVPLLLIYYAFEHKLPFAGAGYTDYAIVSNSVNLGPNSPVRVAGVNVGQVTKVSADGRSTKVAFTLSKAALPIHTDATVTIRDRLFLEGGYYLQLSPGSPSAPIAHEGFTVQEPNTATPVQFFQILSTFDNTTRTNLETLLKTANVAFSPSAGSSSAAGQSGAAALKQAIPELTPDLKDVAQVSQALDGTHANDLERLLASTSDLTTELSAHDQNLTSLIRSLDSSAAALANSGNAVDASISGLDQTLAQTPATLTALDRSLGPLDTLASALTPSLRQSPALVDQLTSEVAQVNKVIAPSQRAKLISSLRTLLVNVPTGLKQLTGLFPPTQAVAACLAERVTPLLEEQVQDGNLSTHDPVWKDLVHFLPNLAGAGGNFDANGPYLRVLAAAGLNAPPSSDLGSFSGLGDLVAASTGGILGNASGSATDTASGRAPSWDGDLTSSDFRPDVSCSSQPLPTKLGADPAEADR